VVSYTTIEIQILFETLLALITSQLAIIGQLGGEVHHEELDCFLGARDNMLEGNSLTDKATRDILVLFWKAMVLPVKKVLSCFQK